MSRYLSFVSVVLLFLIVSCQKEMSFEQAKPSHGSLQDSLGDCLTKTIGGTFIATKTLADSNYIDVTVNVTQAGSYTVYTDTVNGYYFRATGTFNKAGSNTVRMKGFGTPGVAGTDDFTVLFDSSYCNVSVTVLPNAASSGGTAVFTLQSSGSSCSITPAGTYTQGVVLTSANKVDIQVDVTTIGTWTMTTNSVAGFSFAGSGTFTATGPQTITLIASGTPNASGVQTFNVSTGSSSCSFSITVAAGNNPPPNTGDYFPRTVGSHWTYMWDGDPTDTLRWYVISQTKSVSPNTYNIFMEDDGTSIDTLGYFRKSGSDYFQWGDVNNQWGASIGLGFYGFDSPIYSEVTMLKDNQAANYTWTSNSYTGTISGFSVTARNKYTIAQKNVTITSNGVQYPNTIVVKMENQLSAAGSWISDPAYVLFYFTKNYGVTRIDIFDATGTLSDKIELIDYKVF